MKSQLTPHFSKQSICRSGTAIAAGCPGRRSARRSPRAGFGSWTRNRALFLAGWEGRKTLEGFYLIIDRLLVIFFIFEFCFIEFI